MANFSFQIDLLQNCLVKFARHNLIVLTMKISIGNDHAGPDYKKAIVA
ncbi:ribose-5-phosphate isomerase, partial [Flavobacterium circumlabens]